MPKRILVIGALLAVCTSAMVIILAILDVITASELRDSLGKTLSVIAVTIVAVVLSSLIVRIGKRE